MEKTKFLSQQARELYGWPRNLLRDVTIVMDRQDDVTEIARLDDIGETINMVLNMLPVEEADLIRYLYAEVIGRKDLPRILSDGTDNQLTISQITTYRKNILQTLADRFGDRLMMGNAAYRAKLCEQNAALVQQIRHNMDNNLLGLGGSIRNLCLSNEICRFLQSNNITTIFSLVGKSYRDLLRLKDCTEEILDEIVFHLDLANDAFACHVYSFCEKAKIKFYVWPQNFLRVVFDDRLVENTIARIEAATDETVTETLIAILGPNDAEMLKSAYTDPEKTISQKSSERNYSRGSFLRRNGILIDHLRCYCRDLLLIGHKQYLADFGESASVEEKIAGYVSITGTNKITHAFFNAPWWINLLDRLQITTIQGWLNCSKAKIAQALSTYNRVDTIAERNVMIDRFMALWGFEFLSDWPLELLAHHFDGVMRVPDDTQDTLDLLLTAAEQRYLKELIHDNQSFMKIANNHGFKSKTSVQRMVQDANKKLDRTKNLLLMGRANYLAQVPIGRNGVRNTDALLRIYKRLNHSFSIDFLPLKDKVMDLLRYYGIDEITPLVDGEFQRAVEGMPGFGSHRYNQVAMALRFYGFPIRPIS